MTQAKSTTHSEIIPVPVDVTVEEGEGKTHRTETQRVVSYGMGIALWFVNDWLKEIVPPTGSRLW